MRHLVASAVRLGAKRLAIAGKEAGWSRSGEIAQALMIGRPRVIHNKHTHLGTGLAQLGTRSRKNGHG
jgi:hypothetical protein